MPQSGQSRVFISYAHKDGAELARRLHADLTKNFDTWLDIQRLTSGDIWSREIEEAIDRASVVLALLSAGSYTSDICRAEQQRALEKGKCVIPVRVQADCDIPLYLQTRQWLDFSNLKLYPVLLPWLIQSIEKQSGVAVSAELLVRYNNAPALPENFVNRPELLEALRNTLFIEATNRNIALTAMQGMGGIGKTVLAQALCRDEVVQQAFPDGIFWFAIGKESQLDFPSHVKGVPGLDRLLGRYEGEAACRSQYRDVLRRKAALIVVDDVWRPLDVEPFIAESPRSRLLITTRDTSIGAWFGAREFTASLLTDGESRQVLAKWSGRAVEELPPQASEVVRECGHLPLALAMIGAQLKGRPSVLWDAVLDHLRDADLETIKAHFPEPHTTLFRAIQISVNALGATARQHYVELAVMPEDMVVARQVLQCLWGVDGTAAVETAEQFVSLSLAQRDQPEGSIRLHDLQQDYVRRLYPDHNALSLFQSAIRLSSNVIARDPEQFSSQIVGRLLPYGHMPAVERFSDTVVEGTRTSWLRPLQPALHPPGNALTRTLEGHSAPVLGVAVSANGRRAISTSWDKTLKIWDLESGRELHTLESDSQWIHFVAMSEDGRRAISASSLRGTVKVWDVGSGGEVRGLPSSLFVVTCMAWSGDGRRVVIGGSDDHKLKVWDVESWKELRTLEGHSRCVRGVALSGDGRRAVSASDDHTLKVWDVESGEELRTFVGHSAPVYGVAVTPDGRLAISASDDHTLAVWDVESGQTLTTMYGHTAQVRGVGMSVDGRLAVSASLDNTLKVWNLESGHELRTLEGHSGAVNGVALSADGRRAVSASSDTTLKVWELESGYEPRVLEGHTAAVLGVAVSVGGRRAVSASADYTMKVWAVDRGFALRTLVGHSAWVHCVALSCDGEYAVSGSRDHTLRVWEVDSGRRLRTIKTQSLWVYGVAMSPDGQRAVAALDDGTLKMWELASGREVCTLTGHTGAVRAVAVTPDGQRAVSASTDRTLKVWELVSGREVRTLTGHTGAVTAVAVTPDGQRAVSVSLDRTLRVWELATGREVCTHTGHSHWATAVALTRDGRRAALAYGDNTVKVCDLESGEVLATFTCDAPAYCCVFSDAHKLIVAGDAGGHLHFLRLEEPKPKS